MPAEPNAVADSALGGLYRATMRILDSLGHVARSIALEPLIQQGYEPWQIVARFGDLNHDANLTTMRTRLAMVILGAMNAEANTLNILPSKLQQFREFATINPETVAFLERHAADLIRGLEADVRVAVQQVLVQGARNGVDVRTQARQIEAVIGLSRGSSLAVINASTTAYREALDGGATIARAQQIADRAMNRTSQRLIRHRAETIARTECLTGDSVVDSAVVTAAFRRAYDGPIVEVVTSGGRKLSTTPNHPMLTRRGWVPANLIREGDDLVCHNRQHDPRAPGNPDVEQRPATIAQIFESLGAVGIPEREIGRRPDFHGDGTHSEVDILRPLGPLAVGSFAPLYEPVAQGIFAPSDVVRAAYCSACGRLLSIDQQPCGCDIARLDATPAQAVAYGRGGYAEARGNFLNGFPRLVAAADLRAIKVSEELVGIAATRKVELASIAPRTGNASGADNLSHPFLVREHCLRHLPGAEAREIEFDRVRSVSIRPFSGHVYNLSTPYGYFTHNGVYTGNTIRAQNAGQQAVWRDYQRRGLLPKVARKVWIVTPDDRLDKVICAPMDGKEAFVEDDFDTPAGPFPHPPAHPRCRCAMGIAR